MATYAIGDVQGCFDELERLLKQISFSPADKLWFVGDLVNRGPKSLEVLRFVRDLNERAIVVLGNHDLHLVAQHAGCERARKDDTLADVLGAPDCDELVGWLRTRPMMHAEGDYAMVHAGLLPQWSIGKALSLGKEVEAALAGPSYQDFLKHMYGSKPERWDDRLTSWDRLRVIVNAMTRLRFCTRDGEMEFHAKGVAPPPGYFAWFDTRPADEAQTIVCGHWSQLGLKLAPRLAALDSGYVWGGALTALRLEDRSLHRLRCSGYQPSGGGT
jgi:bis(5'-nucleosyl)-tetraphosphatase (symmetrical)